ncbi:hypothetical protein, partial [Cognatilysobacter lacus]
MPVPPASSLLDAVAGPVWKVAIGGLPLARLFDYLPSDMAPSQAVGCRVRVPFGTRERVGVIA